MTPPVAGRHAVYGLALNYRSTLEQLGSALSNAPYGAPPRAPVLYIKPANTWIADGDPIPVPHGVAGVEAGVTLAAVLGRDLKGASPEAALDAIAGFTLVNDVTIPHTDYYRPVIQNRCRDGFCVIGRSLTATRDLLPLDAITMRVWVNDELACTASTAGLVRPVATALADVSAMFTLGAGDIVLLGAAPESPVVRPGDRVAIEVEGVGRLENPVVCAAQASAA
jgi:5-oxopent-3-ene-1,2,5-tricarboxylate decarboxylase / 2-hydroxyhepta-2,4-diene-1,7-dioate isomerase